MSSVVCVVGLQWGDEAKGKIVDLLAEKHRIIVRYNGGSNAGHTIVHGDKVFKLSLLPAGVLRPDKTAVIANGVVVYPPRFIEEVTNLRQAGVSITGQNLKLSDRAHVIFPYHMAEEAAHEGLAAKPIGTTGRGIGPCYADKAGRTYAIRVGELLQPDWLRERLNRIVPVKNKILQALGSTAAFDANKLADEYIGYGEYLRGHITDTTELLHHALVTKDTILFEAAQGSLLDLDHGTFPYVTSSSSTASGIGSAGVPARRLTKVLGVVKAYTTRVGGGPFPTELTDAIGEQIRKVGKEYGTVTGRPRRCGWFDAVAVRYTAALSDADSISLMLLDVLSGLDEVKVCTAYDVDGQRLDHFPSDAQILGRCKPIYTTIPGWKEDISKVRKLNDLPPAARRYIDAISGAVGLPVSLVSVGPDRDQTILC
jgi:adenylosuccinate synthase